MPLVSSAPTMVAGVLGGSGSHVVQIAIGIVVAVLLIGYFLWRLGSRHPSVPARAVVEPRRSGEPGGTSREEAALRLSRIWSGIALGGQSEPWDIVVDGRVVGAIADQEVVEVALTPGHHTLRLSRGRHMSPERAFDVGNGEVVSYRCHGPRFWPLWLAAMIKSDLWITLRTD